jgi:hypothetical protein
MTEQASVVIDLRTGKPAGRFANAAGGDVVALAPIAGRGVLAVDKDNSAGLRVLLLDTCGEQMFSVTVPGANLCVAPTGIVGPGEIAYLQVDPCGGGLSNPQVVGIDLTTGQIVTGPTALVEVPWIGDRPWHARPPLDAGVENGVSAHVVAASLGHESSATRIQSYMKPEAVAGAQQRRVMTVLEGGRLAS